MTSPHPGAFQEPIQSCLIRAKNPVIQEITKVSEALLQEPGRDRDTNRHVFYDLAKPNMIFLYVFGLLA